MSLGVCCQWLEPRTKRDGSVVYENSINERTLQLGRFQKGLYSKSYIREVYINNINEIIKLVPKLVASNLKLFRLSSNLSLDDAFGLAVYTWKSTGVTPLQHLSNTTPGLENGSFTDRRKHSVYIHYIPDCQRDGVVRDVVDIDVEAKMKNLAVGKLVKLVCT